MRLTRHSTAWLILLTLWPGVAWAQAPKAGVVVDVHGQGTVTRTALPQPIPLALREDLFLRDRIDTRENSIARVLLGGKALITIRELSIFTITEEPGRAIVDLQTGKLAVAIAKSRLKPGEAVEIRTPRAIAAVRGSLVVVEVRSDGETIATLHVTLPVVVSLLGDPTRSVSLPSNYIVVLPDQVGGQLPQPKPLTPGQVAALMATTQVPRQGAGLPDGVVDQMVQAAGRLADQLAATPPPGALPNTGLGVELLENAVTRGGSGPPPSVPGPSGPAPGSPPGTPPPSSPTSGGGGVPGFPTTGGNSTPGQGGSPPGQPAPLPPPPSTSPFTPPGQGGAPPNSPTNPTPGQGGIPPGQQPPPSPPPSSAFTPPGQGGARPNSPGNPTPGHGGIPPGQQGRR